MLQRCLRYIRNFFGFSRGEALGFSVLAVLLLLVYGAWLLFSMLPTKPYEPIADQRELDSLMAILEKEDSIPVEGSSTLAASQPPLAKERFFFNPNTLSEDSLQRLGFPAYLARRLVKYRSKGGYFRKKDDLLKLYGMQQSLYQELSPWIQLPPEKPKFKSSGQTYVSTPVKKPEKERELPLVSLDINEADSLQLLKIRGIGPVLSGRILKFRDALGGFASAGQLREVWGLSPETVEAVLAVAYVREQPRLRLLAINQADASLLAGHPYISPRQAKLIVAYRLQHGPYQKAEDLALIHGLEEGFVDKIKPYLDFQQQ